MNLIKVNFYRFAQDVDLNINVIEAKNETAKIKKHLEEVKAEAEAANSVSSKILSSLTSVKSSSSLKRMRKDLETNIKGTIKDIQEYIQAGNASDKFVVRVKPLVDKFEAYQSATDHRRNPKASDITKLSTIEKGLGSAAISEETDKLREATKVQKELNSATKEELKVREQVQKELDEQEQKQQSLKISVSQGIGMFTTGINSIHNVFSSTLKHITGAAVTFRILGGVVSGITGKFKELYDTAAGYEEAVNLYRTALGDFAQDADEWRDRISNALHLDPQAVMQYTGALYNLVQGLGVGENAAYKMAKNMTQLSYDMSSYLNIDVESAYEKVSSAISGQARAVGRVGVAMQVASLQELAYSLGIKKSVNEMTQAEKTYLRYIQLMRSTTKMQQDLGKTILTPENALRVVKAEFIQFARALGQVVIPVVMKVIPYLAALANMLTNVANKLAKTLGYEMAKVDYSSFDTGNSKLKDMSKNLNGVGDSAKKARNEIQRTLAPFDELNVVESESKTAGTGGGGVDSTVLDTLEKYVDEYDMLGKLTGDFDKRVEEAQKNLEKLIPTIKRIAVAFAAWKLIEKVAKFADLVSKFKIGIKEGKGFGGVIKTLGERFAYGYSEATKLGTSGLGAVKNGLSNMLGPLGTVVTTIGLMAVSFTTSKDMVNDFNGSMSDTIFKIVGAGGLTAALTTVTAIFLGPWAAAGVAIAGTIGIIAGLEEAWRKERLEIEKQEGFPELIHNQGIEIEGAYKLVEGGIKDVTDNASALQKLVDANDTVKTSWDNAKEAFEQYQIDLSNGEITYQNHKDLVDGVTDAVDKLKQAGQNRIEQEKINELAALDILAEETKMTKEDYNERKKAIEDYYERQSLYNKGYYDQYKKLLIQREEGTITEKQFREEVEKLQKEYLGLTTVTEVATEKAANYLAAQNGKIDFSDPEKFNDIIKQATERRADYIKQEQDSHQPLIDNWRDQIDEQKKIIDVLEEQYGAYDTMDKKQQDQYDNANTRIDTLTKNIESAEEGQRLGVEKINSTYKNFLSALLLELAATGADQSETFRDSVQAIDKELENIGKDVDPTKSAVDFLGKYAATMDKEGKTISESQARKFQGYGVDIIGSFGYGLLSEFGRASVEYKTKMSQQFHGYYQGFSADARTGGKDVGTAFCEGYNYGITTNEAHSKDVSKKLADTSYAAVKETLLIKSPSKATYELGQYFTEGFANGITSNASMVEDAARRISSKASETLKQSPISMNIDTGIEKSLNTILNKLQRFADNWRDAINKCAKGMKTTLNSLKLDKDGKITYEAMPTISVKKFEKGGFPKSGDLFWANEDGRSEYITSIGNRAAVANQDQMVSALTNAILTGMSQIPSNTQPSNVTVYVGDKKLYEGQGEYQNRQNDRYGTTVVRI